ncbi:MAG: hypothetical protein AB1626_01020 [Candidatus Micrarchaeota archaeon]
MHRRSRKRGARAEDALLKEIYARYGAGRPQAERPLLRYRWVRDGVFAVLVFLAVFVASLAVFPLFLGPAEPAVASAIGLRTVVPVLSLFAAIAATLVFFQLKLARRPV